MKTKIIAIIQARMGSKRLPGKSMKNINGFPLLERIIKSQKGSITLDDYIVATSHLEIDNSIDNLCKQLKIKCFRGSEINVMQRYIDIIEIYKPDLIVRLTADNLFVDSDLIDFCVSKYIKKMEKVSYGYIGPDSGFPFGLSLEIFDKHEFLRSKYSKNKLEQEHVTTGIKKRLEKDKILKIYSPVKVNNNIRLSLDTKADFEFISYFLENLNQRYVKPNYIDILKLCNELENENIKL